VTNTPVIDQEEYGFMTDLGAYGGAPPYRYQWLVSINKSTGAYTASNASYICGSSELKTLNCTFLTTAATKVGTYYFEVMVNDSKGQTAVSAPGVMVINPHLVPIPIPTVVNTPIYKGEQLIIATDQFPSPLNGTPPYVYDWLVSYDGSANYIQSTSIQCTYGSGVAQPGERIFCASTPFTPTGNYTYKVIVTDSSDPQNTVSINSTPADVIQLQTNTTSTSTTSTTIGTTSSQISSSQTSTSVISTSIPAPSTMPFTTGSSSSTIIGNPSTTIGNPSGGGGAGGNSTGSGGGATGGSVKPVLRGFAGGFDASNVSQYATLNDTVCGNEINVIENYITPIYAGVTINGRPYVLYPNAKVTLKNIGQYYFVTLLNISYLPILHTIALNFSSSECTTPVVPPKINQTATTSIPTVRTTTMRTTIFIPFISVITASTTVRLSLIIIIALIIILVLLILYSWRQRKEREEEEELRRKRGQQPRSGYTPPSPEQFRPKEKT